MFKVGDVIKLKTGTQKKFKVSELWYNYWNDEMYLLEDLGQPDIKFSDFKKYVDEDYELSD